MKGMTIAVDPSDLWYSIVIALLACLFVILLGHVFGSPLLVNRLYEENSPEGCKKLGLDIDRSNLADEHVPILSNPQSDQTLWKVKSLFIYPVKSCKGVELEEADCFGTGLEYDRQFSFARWTKLSKGEAPLKLGWKFLTQRDAPLLATIQTEIWLPDHNAPGYSENHPNVRSRGVIRIKYRLKKKGRTRTVDIPYAPTADQTKKLQHETKTMTIWKDSPECILLASTENSDRNHAPWIKDVQQYIGVHSALAFFKVKSMYSRELFRNAPRIDEIGYQPTVGFQDAYPLHIMNLASVQDIAYRFENDSQILSAKNFRPNIIITGGDAYAEDHWKRVKIGDYFYFTSCRTVRCLLPNVDQTTGERHESEPNRTLKLLRKIDVGNPNNACLGMQMVPAIAELAKIRVGDVVTVWETGAHVYINQ